MCFAGAGHIACHACRLNTFRYYYVPMPVVFYRAPAYQRPVANVLTKPLQDLLAHRRVQWAILRGWRVAVDNIDRLVSDRLISTIFEFNAQELALPVLMKALPCSHRTHQHGSLADVDRVEPDDARVVALMRPSEAWASKSSHQGQPEMFEEAFFDCAALSEQNHVDVVLVQRNVDIVSQFSFVLLLVLAQQFPVIPRYVVEGNYSMRDGRLGSTAGRIP